MDLKDAYAEKSMISSSLQYKNGRIDLASPENTATKIQMMERISLKNKAVSYYDAMKGQWEDNVLSQVFFSKENIQIIQNAIRAEVYQKSGNKYVISTPNIDNLSIIMRSTFLTYVEYKTQQITQQIEKLNRIVIDYCVKELLEASKFYVGYLKDQSAMYVPFKQPLNHDRNYKQLELKDWF